MMDLLKNFMVSVPWLCLEGLGVEPLHCHLAGSPEWLFVYHRAWEASCHSEGGTEVRDRGDPGYVWCGGIAGQVTKAGTRPFFASLEI
jgi:hypothetical protein